MIRIASELLTSLNEGQDEMAPARRIRVAVGLLACVLLVNLAAVVTTLAQA